MQRVFLLKQPRLSHNCPRLAKRRQARLRNNSKANELIPEFLGLSIQPASFSIPCSTLLILEDRHIVFLLRADHGVNDASEFMDNSGDDLRCAESRFQPAIFKRGARLPST